MSSGSLNQVRQKPKFSVAITTEGYQRLITNTIGDPDKAKRFVSAISSAVAVNPALQECDAGTILAGGLLGESLGLSPSPQLGHYYLIPFDCKMKDASGRTLWQLDEQGRYMKDKNGKRLAQTEKKAQFVLGYKGYIQLALKSGQIRRMNVIEIKEGEIQHWDPLNEEIDCILIEDVDKREAAPTAGYYVMLELAGGFRKALFWSRQKMESHADRYSPAFSAEAYHRLQRGEIQRDDMWKYSSKWYTDFDAMAKKTMLRQVLGKWSVMSTELQAAYSRDNQFLSLGSGGGIAELPPVELAAPVPEGPEGGPEDTESPSPAEPDAESDAAEQTQSAAAPRQVSLNDL